MSDLKICVYAICKNEIKYVEQWLNSMSEADYIVVLDTGSTDGTYRKLKEDKRVTRVEKKIIDPWRFDVARNESMKLVPTDTDILVCTDFDEEFNKGWAQILRDNWIKGQTTRAHYAYAWSHNSIGEPQDVFIYDKIHDWDYYWYYPVHEVLMLKEGKIENPLECGEYIYLHHYPDKTKERNYFDLLKLAIEENPDDAHIRLLYAREFIHKNDLDTALKEYLYVLRMPDIDDPKKRLCLLDALFQTGCIYADLKNYDEAIWYCQEFIKEDHTYREPYLLMAELYNEMNMFTLAEACLNACFEYGKHHYTWVEKATTWLGYPYDVGSITKAALGKTDEALKYIEEALKHEPNDVRLIKNQNLFLKQKLKEIEDKNKSAKLND